MQLNNQPASTSYSYFFSPDSCGGLVCEPELAAALAAPVWPELAAALAASGSGSTGSTGGEWLRQHWQHWRLPLVLGDLDDGVALLILRRRLRLILPESGKEGERGRESN